MKIKTLPISEAMYYVLLALLKPCHGYQIMSSTKDLTHGRINIGPGTLYGILNRLENEKLIELDIEESRKKIYRLTDKGKAILLHEYNRLLELVKDGVIIREECK